MPQGVRSVVPGRCVTAGRQLSTTFITCLHLSDLRYQQQFHLFAKGWRQTRMTNITECRPQNARSWAMLLSISTPTRAIKVHCRTERGQIRRKKQEECTFSWYSACTGSPQSLLTRLIIQDCSKRIVVDARLQKMSTLAGDISLHQKARPTKAKGGLQTLHPTH